MGAAGERGETAAPVVRTVSRRNSLGPFSCRSSAEFFRELVVPKWSAAFCDAVYRETGSRRFTYVTAVTRLSGETSEWEQHPQFRKAMRNNPLEIIQLSEMVAFILGELTRTPASSDLGRTLQLLKAARVLDPHE